MKRREYSEEDFVWARWTAVDIERAADEFLASKRAAYDRVKGVPSAGRNFENTVYAIETSDNDIWKWRALNWLMNVSPLVEIREAAKLASERIEAAMVDIEYDEALYRAIKEYEAKKEPLAGEEEKLFRDMLRRYRRMGFDLPNEAREVLKGNLKRLSEISSEFAKNINEYRDAIEVTRDELQGLSEAYVAGLSRTESGERFRVSLEYPEMNPFLENATCAAKRRELATKALQKGGACNTALLAEAVQLRSANARLLGYATHAAYVLEERMAKSEENVRNFVTELITKAKPGLRREMEALQSTKARVAPGDDPEVAFCDIAFLSNELKKEKFAVDEQIIREYFPMERVKAGVFTLFEQVFSIRLERVEEIVLWHKDAELYAVRDQDGSIIAYCALDLYPREGKYGHAAAFNVMSGHATDLVGSEYVTPVACMVTNFPKLSAEHPSLLSHSEVETFLHEFGHILHEILTRAKYRSQSGFSVAWDFVEAPSQMFENWAWHRESLALLSGHYQTGESLPTELLDNMLAAKRHMIAHHTMRQMIFALFDLRLHTGDAAPDGIDAAYGALVAQYIGVTLPENQRFAAGFGHLMGGYDAGYYGYMWALVAAADMFTRFEEEGVLNERVGGEYRRAILERGSSRDEAESLRAFLGREPDTHAFLRELGLEG